MSGPTRLRELAAEEDVRSGRQVVAEREVLIDDLDPLLARLDRLVELHRLVVQDDLAGGRPESCRR